MSNGIAYLVNLAANSIKVQEITFLVTVCEILVKLPLILPENLRLLAAILSFYAKEINIL